MAYKTNNLEGDTIIGRHLNIGGKVTQQGSSHIKGNLKVDGWLFAYNVQGANKGLFQTEAKLKEAFPSPQDGWWAIVGNTLPGPIYAASGGVWAATGQEGGQPILDIPYFEEVIEELRGDVMALQKDVGEYEPNGEYIRAYTDNEGKFLWGIKFDGSIEWVKGVPTPVRKWVEDYIKEYGMDEDVINAINRRLSTLESEIDNISSTFSYEENPEYINVTTDKEGKLLEATTPDGKKHFPKQELLEKYSDSENRLEITVDSNDRILAYRDKQGVKYEYKQHTGTASFDNLVLSKENATQIEYALKANGFTFKSPIDWSDEELVQIPIPRTCALVNITCDRLPTTKVDNIPAILEFWDKDGNYFKKRIVLNAQGSSSMAYSLKNLSIDIDDGSEIKFGHWVVQDSFHFKAYYIDVYRGMANFCYNWCEELIKKMNCRSNRLARGQETTTLYSGTGVFDKDFDTGALCHPDGFPIEIYHNGEYHGLFAWNLKKHRKNYMIDKNDATSTILDGVLSPATIWRGTVDWTEFELRNPKDLICMDGSEYDGETPQEPIDSTSSYYDANNKVHRNSATIKDIVKRLAAAVPAIAAEKDIEAAKDLFETYFDKDMMICYFIGSNVIDNYDGFAKNWIWTIYNGGKAAPNFYDLDSCFGRYWKGSFVWSGAHIEHMLGTNLEYPTGQLYRLYSTEIENTYAELRESKMIDVNYLMSFVKDWMDRVGFEAYERNLKKYDDLPSYRNSNINEEYWELVVDTSDSITYNQSTSYEAGDTVIYGNKGENYRFTCVKNCTGIPPISAFYSRVPYGIGMFDTPERIRVWLTAKIAYLDNIFNYNV